MASKKNDKRDSFVFYRGWYESIKLYPPEKQSTLYNMIFEYALNGESPQGDDLDTNVVFNMVKPLLDSNYKRYLNGVKGGRPSKNQQKDDQGDHADELTGDPILDGEIKKKNKSFAERFPGS